MNTIYTITRYPNGWLVDTKTGDSARDYSAVFEDTESDEGDVDSLLCLLVNTFNELEEAEFYFPTEEEVVEANANL